MCGGDGVRWLGLPAWWGGVDGLPPPASGERLEKALGVYTGPVETTLPAGGELLVTVRNPISEKDKLFEFVAHNATFF